jgi:hypothetical protein
MANKKFWLVILVLVFGVLLTGCGELFLDKGYTFEFKVINNMVVHEKNYITKIEFINGSTENAKILQTENINLPGHEVLSSLYKVSGFTETPKGLPDDNRYFGVRITLSSGETLFAHYYGHDKNKIRVEVERWISSATIYLNNCDDGSIYW